MASQNISEICHPASGIKWQDIRYTDAGLQFVPMPIRIPNPIPNPIPIPMPFPMRRCHKDFNVGIKTRAAAEIQIQGASDTIP